MPSTGIASTLAAWLLVGTASAGPAADPASIARSIEQAVNDRDVQAIHRHTDLRAMVGVATRDLDFTPAERLAIVTELDKSFDLGGTIIAGIGRTGHYKLLRLHETAGQTRALFRMVTSDGGLNYHDLIFAANGRPAIVDAYVYMSGELMSETLRRTCERFLQARPAGQARSPSVRLNELMSADRCDEALAYFDQLPAPDKSNKILHIQRIVCAGRVSAAALDRACDDFRRRFPGDPCVDLVTLDQLIQNGRWDDAISAVARIRRHVGPDAYLEALTALFETWAGRPQRGAAAVERALDLEPGLEQAHTARLEVAVALRDHEQTARTLDELEDRFGYEILDLTPLESYAEFVRSEVYREWMASRQVEPPREPTDGRRVEEQP